MAVIRFNAQVAEQEEQAPLIEKAPVMEILDHRNRLIDTQKKDIEELYSVIQSKGLEISALHQALKKQKKTTYIIGSITTIIGSLAGYFLG